MGVYALFLKKDAASDESLEDGVSQEATIVA